MAHPTAPYTSTDKTVNFSNTHKLFNKVKPTYDMIVSNSLITKCQDTSNIIKYYTSSKQLWCELCQDI